MSLSLRRSSELMGRPYTRVLAEHEIALARLYDCLGSTFAGEGSEFWRKLAQEEIDHRDIIQHIEEKMDECNWQFELPNFKYKDVVDAIEWIADIRERMSRDGISMNKALEIAISIEMRILESDFFAVITPSNDEITKSLEELTAYTAIHLQSVKDEAKKMKWKFFGNKQFRLVNVMDKWETSVDVEAKMRTAQADILDIIMSLEEAASSLYRTYGQKLPEMEKFWSHMAAEERQHSSMLRKLHSSLEEGHLFKNLGRFKKESLQAEIKRVKDYEDEAMKGRVTPRQALSNALGVEKNMAEGDFYTIVESDAEEFRIIAARLVQLTKSHMKDLKAELNKHLV